MRIIAGRHRGRTIRAPVGRDIRPTADRARQALFNILTHRSFEGSPFALEGARVLDAFCGTGAMGIEALSRGARHAFFLDNNRVALGIARENLQALSEDRRATLFYADATRPPKGEPCNLVLLDPPYGANLAVPALRAFARHGWLAPDAVIVAEIGAREELAAPADFDVLEERRYGAAKFVILRYRPAA
ncbi:MAG: 16S rRNA (guanine(966)-N(2))-methyltransferase RsmD [Alphaproteobacteria bacterium]